MEEKKVHIGEIVEKAFNQSSMTKIDFSNAIGIHNQNLNREFKKCDWSVIKLINAGNALNYDFSFLFSKKEKEIKKPKAFLQIEIDENKINEILDIVNNNQLYQIIKK